MSFLAKYWKVLVGAAALVAAYGGGYASHRCPQAVHLEQTAKVDAQKATTADVKDHKDPAHIVTRRYRPPAPGCTQPVLASETVIDQGAELKETKATSQEQVHSEQKTVLTITPKPLAKWAIDGGLDDVFKTRPLRLEFERRLFDTPVWVKVGVVPVRRELGVYARWEF